MKKFITLSLVVLTLIITINKSTFAQEPEYFSMGELDPYVSAYMEPFARAMAVSMSGGWTHTAKVHSTLGFDITFSASIVGVPASDKTFNTNSINMTGYTFNPTGTDAPTISADNGLTVPNISKDFNNELLPEFSFAAFQGLNINTGGMAAIQAGIGLPKGTEIIIRFIPDMSSSVNKVIPDNVDFGMEKTGMWGFGVKHDIKQWIPVISKVPFLQISGLFTFSKFYTGFSGADLRFDPDRFSITSSLPTTTWDNQKIDIGMSSFTGALLVGANLPIFQPYIGLGFNSAKFEGGFKGNYPIIEFSTEHPNGVVNTSEADPLPIEAKATDFNFQAGARLKLGFFVLYYQYTIQKYSMNTFGIAFTLR